MKHKRTHTARALFRNPRQALQKNRGFSMVELMVGIAIGLLGMLVVMQAFSVFEGQKRTTTSGSDAETNGGLGMFSIERDARAAGYGLAGAAGCQMTWAGAPSPLLMAPVSIAASGITDTLTLISSNKQSFSQPVAMLGGASSVTPETVFPFAQNDLVLAYPTTDTPPACALFQVKNVPTATGNTVLDFSTGAFNTAAGVNLDKFNASASPHPQLMNLGSLLYRTYVLDKNHNLTVLDYDINTNAQTGSVLSTDIVALKAQYGYDGRSGTQSDAQVTAWGETLPNPATLGLTTAQDVIQRVYAVRLILVARSGLKEKAVGGTTCNTTPASANNITWAGGTVDLRLNPDNSSNADWQCYRYKTFESVIPIRNMVWSK